MPVQSRKDEILAKRAKLAELKRQKELRQKDFSTVRHSTSSTAEVSPSPPRSQNRQELDSLISSLVGDEKRSPAPGTTPSARRSRQSYVTPRQDDQDVREAVTSHDAPLAPTGGPQTMSFAPLITSYEIKSGPPSREVITYSKGVQTADLWSPHRSPSPSDSEPERSLSSGERQPRRGLSRRQREREEQLRQNIRKEIEEELKTLKEPQGNEIEADAAGMQANFPARALSNEEVEAVTSSADFLDFVERSSKVIERALDEEYDVLADYRHSSSGGVEDDENELGGKGRKGRRMKEVINFYDERWSKKRMISDIGFSPKFPELILSAHTKNPSAPYDPDGLIQVWNMHMHSRPEYTFHGTSDILTAKFSPFHPNLILAGSYSGQVLLFDTRSRTPHPVQRTPLTGSGHTHPVYSLNIVGTQNAHNIISTSTDGVMCTWSVDMLAHPQEYLELTAPPTLPPSTSGVHSTNATAPASGSSTPFLPTRPTDDLAPTSTAFPPSDPTYALLATESGALHIAHRYSRAGARAGIDARVVYAGHAAPVMSLDFHRPAGPMDLGDLVLSSSLDWSVKLWRIRTPAAASIATASVSEPTGLGVHGVAGAGSVSAVAGSASGAPNANAGKLDIYSSVLDIPREDAVYDAKWSPVKPGVFACVDGAGALEVWDLTMDTEVPVTRAFSERYGTPDVAAELNGANGAGRSMGASMAGGLGASRLALPHGHNGARSLNKCAWEPHEGRRIAAGGLDGVLGVWEVGGELGGAESARPEEWGRVKRLVQRCEGAGG